MTPQTKAQALAKLAKMRNKVGYPDMWRDYSALTVARADFFGNVSRAHALRVAAAGGEDRQAGGPRRMGHDARRP